MDYLSGPEVLEEVIKELFSLPKKEFRTEEGVLKRIKPFAIGIQQNFYFWQERHRLERIIEKAGVTRNGTLITEERNVGYEKNSPIYIGVYPNFSPEEFKNYFSTLERVHSSENVLILPLNKGFYATEILGINAVGFKTKIPIEDSYDDTISPNRRNNTIYYDLQTISTIFNYLRQL